MIPDVAQLKVLTDQLRDIETRQEFFALAKQTYEDIPPDTKKALARKWVSKAKELSAGKLAAYEVENQERDHKRIIPLPLALSALQALEAELVRTQIEDLADIMWKRFKNVRRVYEALHVNWSGVWKALVELWNYIKPPEDWELLLNWKSLIAGSATVGAFVLEAMSEKAFMAVALSVAKEREKCIATMRRKALPQPPAKRYRRRKRAR